MNNAISIELQFFLVSVISGTVLLLVYDCLRIFRRVMKHDSFFVALEDMIFWVCASLFIFAMMYQENDGIIRGFSIMGMASGMLLYHYAFSDLVVKWISKLINMLMSPFAFALKLIKKFLSFLWSKEKKVLHFLINRLKKYLKSVRITLNKRKLASAERKQLRLKEKEIRKQKEEEKKQKEVEKKQKEKEKKQAKKKADQSLDRESHSNKRNNKSDQKLISNSNKNTDQKLISNSNKNTDQKLINNPNKNIDQKLINKSSKKIDQNSGQNLKSNNQNAGNDSNKKSYELNRILIQKNSNNKLHKNISQVANTSEQVHRTESTKEDKRARNKVF